MITINVTEEGQDIIDQIDELFAKLRDHGISADYTLRVGAREMDKPGPTVLDLLRDEFAKAVNGGYPVSDIVALSKEIRAWEDRERMVDLF